MLEIEGDNKKYQIQKCNNLPRGFLSIIGSSLLLTDPLLEVLATTLPALPPVLCSSNYWGGGERQVQKWKAAPSRNQQLTL